MGETFVTTLFQAEGKNATGIEVPADVILRLGAGKKPAVTVTLNGAYSYRSTVAVYGDTFLLPVSREHREAAGVNAGDEMQVTLELDSAPREVELPEALRAALTQAGALDAYEAAAPSRKKEFVRQVNDAKTEETRERRIAKIVATLAGG